MRIRYGVVAAFGICSLLSLYLGFANISLPHDKLIHFMVFFMMTTLFYWILDAKQNANWIRYGTFLVCTLIGGVGSEYAQNVISPFRSFDVYDIVSNVAGSVLAICLSELYKWFSKEKNDDVNSIELNIV